MNLAMKQKQTHKQKTDLWLQRGSRGHREGSGTPLQYYCLGNPMDRGAWQAAVHGVAKNQTQLSDFTSLHDYLYSIYIVVGIISRNDLKYTRGCT